MKPTCKAQAHAMWWWRELFKLDRYNKKDLKKLAKRATRRNNKKVIKEKQDE